MNDQPTIEEQITVIRTQIETLKRSYSTPNGNIIDRQVDYEIVCLEAAIDTLDAIEV